MSQNIYLNKSNWNYWFNYNNSYYGIYDENKFINMFLPFLNVNKLIEYNEKITNSIVIHDIQSDGIFDNKNINIMLCIENCKFWNHYNHINKYGEFGNDKISIYLYNHINKLIISSQYIAIQLFIYKLIIIKSLK